MAEMMSCVGPSRAVVTTRGGCAALFGSRSVHSTFLTAWSKTASLVRTRLPCSSILDVRSTEKVLGSTVVSTW
jgi:hypothetical protein